MIGFVLRRLFAQRLLALAMVVTLAFTVGVLVAGPIYADAGRGAILSSELAGASVTVKAVRITAYGSGRYPFAAADRDVLRAISGLPEARVIRQGLSTISVRNGSTRVDAPILFRDGASTHLELGRGRFPTGPGEILLSEGVAKLLHVRVGRPITIGAGKARLVVSGTYDPPSHPGAYWFGSRHPFPAPDSTEPAPMILTRAGYLSVVARAEATSLFTWDAYLDLLGLPYEQAVELPPRVAAVRFPDSSPVSHASVTTGLGTLVDVVRLRSTNLRIPVYLVAFQIGGVALAVLAGVASLALTRQSFELAVMRSRGFSRARLMTAQAAQTVVTTVVGYPIGLLIGLGLAGLATHANGRPPPGTVYPIRLSAPALVAGAVGAVAAATLVLLLSIPVVSRTVIEERRQLSREARPLLSRLPVELFVAPLGIAAFYEVRAHGFVSDSGSLDPLLLLAPTLLLFAGSFLVLRILLFALRRLEAPIGRARRLAPYLAGRRLARSAGTSFAISLLLVLAVGLLVVSTTYRATIIRSHEDSAHQLLGADWQVDVGSEEDSARLIDRMPPSTTPVLVTQPIVDRTFKFPPLALGVDTTTFPAGGWWRTDYASRPLNEIMSDLGAVATGQALNEPGRSLSVAVASKDLNAALRLHLLATFGRSRGVVRTVDMGPIDDSVGTYETSARQGERLLSLLIAERGTSRAPRTLRLTFYDRTGGTLGLNGWRPLRWRGSAEEIRSFGSRLEVEMHPGVGSVLGGLVPAEDPLPVLVSTGFGEPAGSLFETQLGSQTLAFRSIGTSRAFPSATGDFMVMALRPLLARLGRVGEPSLTVDQVWAMGEDPRPGLRQAGFVPGDARSSRTIVQILAQLPQSLAVGMHFTAAAGGMGLVVVGVGVGLYFTQRRREFEFAALRAMGSRRGQVTAILLTEQSLLVAFAIAGGLGLGFGILRLMLPSLGKAIGAAFPPPVLIFDWTTLGVYGAAILAGTASGLLLALRALRRSSVTSVLRGEAE